MLVEIFPFMWKIIFINIEFIYILSTLNFGTFFLFSTILFLCQVDH